MDTDARRYTVLLVIGLTVGLLLGGVVFAVTNDFDDSTAGKIENGTFGAPDGLNVTIEGETRAILANDTASPDSRTLRFVTEAGNITLAASGVTSVDLAVDEITGTETRLHNINAGSTYIEANPEDKQRVDVRGDVNEIAWRSMTIDDGTQDFAYRGTDGGTTSVRIYDLPADTRVVAVEAADGDYLDHATTNSNGRLELNLPNSEHEVELVTVDGDTPQFANASPERGFFSDAPDDLSVDVSDGDMPSDEIDVTISLDGSQIHSETITSNQTVSTSNLGTVDLGDNQWTVEATDEFGNTQTEQYNFRLPANITVRNEQNASQVITGRKITAKFFSANGEIVVERSDSNDDGNISMRGLPDTNFVVTVDADQYVDRRIYIDSIGEQSNIYVLNSSVQTIDTIFQYEDRTSRFEQRNTTLTVERAVDPDNDDAFEFQTIAGDFWGAAGQFPFTGEEQERYRLVVTNRETGAQRVLGTHIPVANGVKNIIVGTIRFEAEAGTGTYFDAGVDVNTGNLQMLYQDPENSTDELRIRVYERGNESAEVFNSTFSGPVGEVTASVLESELEDTSYTVEFIDGKGRVVGQLVVGGGSYNLPLDPTILTALALNFVVFIGSLYGPRVALMGSWAMVGLAGMLMMFGWLQVPVAGLTLAAAIALGATFYRERVPG